MGIQGLGHLKNDPEYSGDEKLPKRFDPMEEGETYTGVVKQDEENQLGTPEE
jgi:hypothetical protein